MSLPPISPPGGATWHVVLALLGPSLLALGGAAAAALSGWRRPAAWIAAIALVGSLVIASLILRPQGAMSAFESPVLQGHLRVGWLPNGLATSLLVLAIWRWRPRGGDAIAWQHTPWSWCARAALAAAMPVLLFPGLWLAAEIDAEGTEPRGGARWQHWRLTLAVLGSLPAILGLPAWLGLAGVLACYGLVAITCRGWWSLVAMASGLILSADLVLAELLR